MFPKVSVFICVYQQAHFIRDTIESVLAQNYPNLEIVVGDDGSTDGTQEILREYDEKYPELFKLILSPVNAGITANSNKVLTQCSGDYVALLGGDDLWLPGKLQKQLECFKENPDAAICYTRAEKFQSSTGEVISVLPKGDKLSNSYSGLGDFLNKKPNYVASSFMIPRWATPEAGFDERVKWVSDWIFLMDVLSLGRMVLIDEVLTRYRRHADNVTSIRKPYHRDLMLACTVAKKKFPNYAFRIERLRCIFFLQHLYRSTIKNYVVNCGANRGRTKSTE